MKKYVPAKFIYIALFLAILLTAGSCGILNKNLPPGETVYDDELEEYLLTARVNYINEDFLINGVSREYGFVSDLDRSNHLLVRGSYLFTYDGGDIIIDVAFIRNNRAEPNLISIFVLNDGVPVRFSLWENDAMEYAFKHLLIKGEDIEDERIKFTPEFSVPDMGRVTVLLLGNAKSTMFNNVNLARGEICFFAADFPKNYI